MAASLMCAPELLQALKRKGYSVSAAELKGIFCYLVQCGKGLSSADKKIRVDAWLSACQAEKQKELFAAAAAWRAVNGAARPH